MLLASLNNYWSLKSGKLHKIMCGHDFPDMSARLHSYQANLYIILNLRTTVAL